MVENIKWFLWSVYNMHFLGYISMCTDTLCFVWTITRLDTTICHIMSYIYRQEWLVNKTKYILYHVCCNSRESLPGDDDDDDDDNDTSDMSICNIQATDDEVAEIFRKHISQLHHIICGGRVYLVMMMMMMMIMIPVICQYAIYKLQMMKLLKYSENTYHSCITSYVHRYTIFYVNNLADWTLQYAILCHIYRCEWDKKTYDIIFALTIETAYLVMMMMMIQVMCQHVMCNLQMMKLLTYSNNK